MNPELCILAFLAARWPASYDAAAVARRVTASGMLDEPVSEVKAVPVLKMLADIRGYASHESDPMTGRVYWTATKEGVSEWVRRGSPQIP